MLTAVHISFWKGASRTTKPTHGVSSRALRVPIFEETWTYTKNVATREKEVLESKEKYKSSRLCRSNAMIKKHISMPLVRPLIVVSPKHARMIHRTHSFIVNVQPSLCIATVYVRVKYINRMTTFTCRLALVAEYSTQRVSRRRGSSSSMYHNVWIDRAPMVSQL
jgi:hypothetical protein